jgi:hypothetical protein
VSDGGCNAWRAGVGHAYPHTMMWAGLVAATGDDDSSCIGQRRGRATNERMARLELAREFWFPGSGVLRWSDRGHQKKGAAARQHWLKAMRLFNGDAVVDVVLWPSSDSGDETLNRCMPSPTWFGSQTKAFHGADLHQSAGAWR